MADKGKSPSLRLEDSFAYILYKSARLLRYHFARLMLGIGLEVTQEQWFILNRLSEKRGQSQAELCDGLFEDRPNITRMLTTMERNGWVTREPDPDDARKLRVALTAKGTAVHARVRDAVSSERRALFSGLGKQDLNEMKRILSHLEHNMTVAGGERHSGAKSDPGAER